MFSSTNKGFAITFENGWTASVQWGPGNYCDNQNDRVDPFSLPKDPVISKDAEIAAWDSKGVWHRFESDDVKGYCKPAEVLEFLNMIANKEKQND